MADLLYYREENERHPELHKARCTKGEAAVAVRRLWTHFAGRAHGQPMLTFTSGVRISHAGRHSITLNVDRMNWLLVAHEVSHSLDQLRKNEGRRSSEHRWHSKYHAAWVDRLCAYITELGWPTGNLAHELALMWVRAEERAQTAAKPPPIEARIEKRQEQVKRLEKKIKALSTRLKTAKRSLAALERVARRTP